MGEITDDHVLDLAPLAYDKLLQEGFPEEYVVLKLENMAERDVIEYGTSIKYVWPVDYMGGI